MSMGKIELIFITLISYRHQEKFNPGVYPRINFLNDNIASEINLRA